MEKEAGYYCVRFVVKMVYPLARIALIIFIEFSTICMNKIRKKFNGGANDENPRRQHFEIRSNLNALHM